MNKNIVGTRIRQFRVSSKLTQADLAGLVDVDPSFIGKVERGERDITTAFLDKLAKALKVTAKDLFPIAVFIFMLNTYNACI